MPLSCGTVFTRLNIFADKNISGAGGGTSAKYIYWKRLPLEHRTSNVRLPLELRSDRPQTLGKRVSDDLQLSIFQLQKKTIFSQIAFCMFWGSPSVVGGWNFDSA